METRSDIQAQWRIRISAGDVEVVARHFWLGFQSEVLENWRQIGVHLPAAVWSLLGLDSAAKDSGESARYFGIGLSATTSRILRVTAVNGIVWFMLSPCRLRVCENSGCGLLSCSPKSEDSTRLQVPYRNATIEASD